VPTLIGGGANASTFAAIAEYGDGWMPIGGSGLTEALPKLRAAVADRDRDPRSIRVVPFGTVPTMEKLDHYLRLGVDEVVLRIPSGSESEMLKELDRCTEFLGRFGDEDLTE
jgi:hypothetical protein